MKNLFLSIALLIGICGCTESKKDIQEHAFVKSRCDYWISQYNTFWKEKDSLYEWCEKHPVRYMNTLDELIQGQTNNVRCINLIASMSTCSDSLENLNQKYTRRGFHEISMALEQMK
jgi:hypothetical protein